MGGLRDIFGLAQSASYVPPQEVSIFFISIYLSVYLFIYLSIYGYLRLPIHQVWLAASKGKGLELSGTFARKGGQIFMELTLSNKALQPMVGFAIQLNKNR